MRGGQSIPEGFKRYWKTEEFLPGRRASKVIEVVSIRPIGNILDAWDTVLEPFDQDRGEC